MSYPPRLQGDDPAWPVFRRSAPVLLLAPHLRLPAHNGADLTQAALAHHLSTHVPFVDVVAEQAVLRYAAGALVRQHPYANRMRSPVRAALRTLRHRSHYLLERFLTPAFRKEATNRLCDPAYGTVLYSYCCTASLMESGLPLPGRLHLVYTHNDQLAWFRNLAEQTHNPARRLVARISERWYQGFFARHGQEALFLYVTETDRDGHRAELPDHAALVVPIGVEIPETDGVALAPQQIVRLMFVGALSVGMNHDALSHFATRFWPAIANRLGAGVEMTVVGSQPTPAVEQVCKREGWALEADVSDERLGELYRSAAFAVLPFAYATGAKLKLLGALAHGVPVLATPQVAPPMLPPPSVVSDDPAAWASACARIAAEGLTMTERSAQQQFARRSSWASIVDRMVHTLAPPDP